MALGGGCHVFGAVVTELDWMAGLHREQCRVASDYAGEVLLAAEGSAGFGLDDAALFGWEVEDQFECVDEVVRALQRASYCYTFGLGVFGYDSVVLDIELLLGSGAVLAFDDVVGGLPDFVG